MKTRIKIKNLRIALLTAFLIMFSFSGFSQACPGNQITLSLQNITQTSTTLEYDVYLMNTGTTAQKLSAYAGNIRFPAGMLTSGTLTVIDQPSATGNFPGISNLAPSLAIANQQARWTNTPFAPEPSSVNLPSNVDLKFARFRITNTGTPWVTNYGSQLYFSVGGGGGISLNTVTVYCNGNTNSTPISLATSTLILVNPVSETCFTSGSFTEIPESCLAANDGSATITMAPIPSDLAASYVLDGGASVAVTLTAAGTFTITGLAAGAHTLSVTGSGGCTTAVSVPFTITTNPTVTPTFTQVTPICSGATLVALPTTSNNAITGSWAPALDNTTTTTYTFTPDAGQCASTATMTITVNPNVTPTFTQVAPICAGTTLAALPTTSTNSITGTWAPALDNTTTTTYTFTPDAGQCGSTTTMTITVNPSTTNTTTITACNSYTWAENGVTYTTSGIYTVPGTLQSGIFNNTGTWASTAAANGATVSTTPLTGLPTTTPTNVTVGTTAVSINATGGMYSSGTFVGTNQPNQPLTMTFTPAVYGVAGNYFVTDISDAAIAGTITIAYSNGTTDTQAVSAVTDYFGIFSSTPISSVTITPVATTPVVNRYVSINNLSVAVAGCLTQTLDLTITPSTNNTTTVTACDSYTWAENGVTYTTSGVYTVVASLQSGIFNNSGTWASTAAANGATVSTTPLTGLPTTTPTNVTVGTTAVSINATGGMYSSGTFVGTNQPNQPLTMTFTPAVYGVAGNYFVTDISDAAIAGTITIAYSNGTTDTQAVSAVTDYFGIFSSTPISSVTITPVATTPVVNRYVSVNNLSVAVAPAGCQTETLDLTINTSVTPTFTQVAPICAGATLAALPTTSNNTITGTWAPALDNTTTTTYTFTPDAGQCATTTTMTITVNQPTTPTFAQVAPVCSGATLTALPTTSNNAITGSWAPVLDNTTTTTYTFTPDAGQCATTTTMTIVVNQNPVLAFTANPFPVCVGSSTVLAVSASNFTPVVNFVDGSAVNQSFNMNPAAFGTPVAAPLSAQLVNVPTDGCTALTPGSLTGKIALIQRGVCGFGIKAQNAQDAGAIGVLIYNNVAGAIIPGGAAPTVTIPVYGITQANGQALIASMTAGEVPVTLSPAPTLSYLWAGGQTTSSITTGVLNANTDFTVTVTNVASGCATTNTVTVPVTPLIVPTFNPVAAICAGETLAALPTTSTNGIAGTWAPALDNTTTTTYTFTPTPVAGQCFGTATLTITVNPLTTNGSVTTTACGSYTWPANGVTYTTSQSGITVVTGCNTATLNLTIDTIDYANLQFPDTQTLCEGQSFTAYGQVYEAGITDVSQTLQGTGIDVEFGVSPVGGSQDPATWTNWSVASYNPASICYPCNNDEYQFTTGATLTAGTYYYTFRYKLSSCSTWQYGGYPNGFWNGTSQNSGVLTVNAAPTPTGSATQSFSVVALNDATIADLVVSPTNVIWYGSLADAQSATNPLASTTVLTNGSTYWAVNVVGACSSTPFGVTVTVTLGNEDFDSLNFAYYPNPTSSTLNISYSKAITEIQVTNMLGQVILTKKTNETEVQVDLSPFAEATYFVKVTSEDKSKIVKVIKRN